MKNKSTCIGKIIQINKENIVVYVNSEIYKGEVSKCIRPIIQERFQELNASENYYFVGQEIEVLIQLDAKGQPHISFTDGLFRNLKKDIKMAMAQRNSDSIIGILQPGMILSGKVKSITSFGAYIDLNGAEGLVHITNMSWGRVTDPNTIVSLGQEIKVVILKINIKKKSISLGLKQLTKHPWELLNPNLKAGDHIIGKVVKIVKYGVFLEIIPGLEGIVYISNMAHYKSSLVEGNNQIRNNNDCVKIGDEVDAVILSIDYDERKIALRSDQLYSSL